MTEKRVKVMIHGADGELWHSGQFEVTVTDLFDGLKRLQSKKSSAQVIDLRLRIPFDAGQVYGVTVSAKKHRSAFTLVRRQDFIDAPDEIESDTFETSLMVVPDKPVSRNLDAGHGELQALGSPLVAPGVGVKSDAFDQLEPAAKMTLLNIEAKLRATLVGGVPLLSFVAGVRHVAVDRLFLFMLPGAKNAVALSRDFADAPGHGAPNGLPSIPAHPDSFKHTRFGEGNVQLSFSERTEPFVDGGGALCHSVDVDLDLARGLKHVVEFLENNVFKPGKKTDQTLVYALLFNQRIRPKYTLELLQARARSTRGPSTRGRGARGRPS
ncbi:MAG: hypothetical protein ACRD3C_20300 [Vicinamibacterales bacterium]